jgi:predicted RNase H-like HicB family nuclease
MLNYPIRLIPDGEGGVIAAFPDVPEAESQGATEDEAIAGARGVLETVLASYVADGRPIPAPTDTCCAPMVATDRFGLAGMEIESAELSAAA